MNGELFHDALDLLDDDLIEAVDALRSRKKRHTVGWAACMAACLCLVLVGALAFLPQLSPPPADRRPGEWVLGQPTYGGENHQGPVMDGNSWSNGGVVTLCPAIVEISDCRSDGFTGKLAAEYGGLAAGSTVEVRLSEPLDIPPGSTVQVWVSRNEGNILYAKSVERVE